MPRIKKYIETDVLTEARERMRHLYRTFDSVVVMFSGGKDSLVCMHLAREIGQEFGEKKVKCVFRDNEIIPQEVADFVDEYRRMDWVDMRWLCLPIPTVMSILGNTVHYTQWDPARTEYARAMPEYAERNPDGVTASYDQRAMDAYISQKYPGRVAMITGVRADESLMRLRSVVNKLGRENWINSPPEYARSRVTKKFKLCKPIYDWSENDVFRFFFERGIRYCPVYNSQLYADVPLRVSTPEHPQAVLHFDKLKAHAPDLYQRVVDIWPDMILQERYAKDVNRNAVLEKYGEDFDGVRQWVMDTLTDESTRSLALLRLRDVISRARSTPESYPPKYVLKAFLRGEYKKQILPLQGNKRSSAK